MVSPGGYAQTEPYVAPRRSDDEVMAYLLSPSGPLRPGTEVTPELVAQYRQNGGEQQMDASDRQHQAENAAYRAAQTGSMGMLTSGPMSSGVADPRDAFMRFMQSGYSGADALRDGWLTGTGTPGWENSPGYSAPTNPNGYTGSPAPVSAVYGEPTGAASTGPSPAAQVAYQQAAAPAARPTQPGTAPASPATNTIPPPATQPGIDAGTPSMPSPPAFQQSTTARAPQPARSRGFGMAPRWNGGGPGMRFGQRQLGGWGQQHQAMRNMYGGG